MIIHDRVRFWGTFLLAVAMICLALAWSEGFRFSHALISSGDRVALVLVVTASLLAALGIRDIAGLFFNMDNKSWYGQSTAVACIAVLLAIIMGSVCTMTSAFLDPDVLRALLLNQLVPLGIACTLAWIIITDWPRRKKSPSDTSMPVHMPPQGSSVRMPEPDYSHCRCTSCHRSTD